MRASPPPSRSRAARRWKSSVSTRRRPGRAGSSVAFTAGGSVDEVSRGPRLDVGDEIGGGGAGPEQAADTLQFQRLGVLLGNDAAAGEENAGAPLFLEQLADPGEE